MMYKYTNNSGWTVNLFGPQMARYTVGIGKSLVLNFKCEVIPSGVKCIKFEQKIKSEDRKKVKEPVKEKEKEEDKE